MSDEPTRPPVRPGQRLEDFVDAVGDMYLTWWRVLAYFCGTGVGCWLLGLMVFIASNPPGLTLDDYLIYLWGGWIFAGIGAVICFLPVMIVGESLRLLFGRLTATFDRRAPRPDWDESPP